MLFRSHPTAHAIVALARIAPNDARSDLFRFTKNPIPQVRAYTARAAALLGDTATLRTFATDKDDNVAEAAITGLARVSGHADDDAYLTALASGRKPVVRAAAVALKGSPRGPAVLTGAIAAAELYKEIAGLQTTTVKYKDANTMLLDLLRGELDWISSDIVFLASRASSVRILALTSSVRSP